MDQFQAPQYLPSDVEAHVGISDPHAISTWSRDAAAWVERYTGHILMARTVTEQINGFSRGELKAWPIFPTTVPAVSYEDASGAMITVPARIDASRRPARILPAQGSRWPHLPSDTIVTVSVRAGYESELEIPPNFNRAMLVLIGAYDADREGGDIFQQAEKSARSLCSSYRLRRV